MSDRLHFFLESAAFFAVLVFVSVFVCTDLLPFFRPLAQPYLVYLPLAWCALRLGLRTTQVAIGMVALVAVFGAAAGTGAFAHNLLGLQLFLMVTGVFLLFATPPLRETRGAEPPVPKKTEHIAALLPAPQGETIALPSERVSTVLATPAVPVSLPRSKHAVLVVDDNHKTAISLAALLNHSGHVAQIALDSAQALTALADFRPDIVFLDVGLPRGGAFEAATLIRRYLDPPPVFIALTQSAEEGRAAHERGFDAHLVKPISIAELEEALSHAA